ncbi:hypothetical protein Y032_0032g2613 [Ancylostoma ceylanicum]|uniref:Uncharacterized protein n=1 Tax=Ancylostoma ceylanicum TaxID=53326 RepID=A0A016UPB7_9BILA|nr:hypothetical protein Y032_0032g2613 [Ancylostoma ceylanicum]
MPSTLHCEADETELPNFSSRLSVEQCRIDVNIKDFSSRCLEMIMVEWLVYAVSVKPGLRVLDAGRERQIWRTDVQSV